MVLYTMCKDDLRCLENICRFYANAVPFYVRGMAVCRVLYLWLPSSQFLVDTEGQMYFCRSKDTKILKPKTQYGINI